MKSWWLVCAFATVVLLSFGCSSSDNGSDGGSGAAGGDGGTVGTGGIAGDGGGAGIGGGSGGEGGTGGMDFCEGVDCTSADDCVQHGACNPADGSCMPGDDKPRGTQCDLVGIGDGICDDGDCVERPDCAVPDDCLDIACMVKDCVLGVCDYQPNDGEDCEIEAGVPGTCAGNVCVGLCEDETCPSSNDCVMDGTCDEQTGECIRGDVEPEGAPCGDNGTCDGAGTCIEVACNVDDDCQWEQTCEDNTCVGPKIAFREAFESGQGPWTVENGVWEFGDATGGPAGSCISGSQCVGTVLNGDYPFDTDSRLRSGTIVLPAVSGDEELHLRFQNWFEYVSNYLSRYYDVGQVQISVRDEAGTFGDWEDVGTRVANLSEVWSVKDVDLTAYAGETVRIGFLHSAHNNQRIVRSGWYIDDVEIVCEVPAFAGTENFESGWVDWSADNGVWQIGEATSGPGSCFGGSFGCAATVLDGDHPEDTDSRLISGTIALPEASGNEELRLRFQNWFEYASNTLSRYYDVGQVQISIRDAEGTFGDWEDVGTRVGGESAIWSVKDVDLTVYAGETVRIGFLHSAHNNQRVVRSGWYIDDIEILKF